MVKKIKGIIRIMSTDIKGNVPIGRALRNIKGIGYRLSHTVLNKLNIDCRKKINDIDKEKLETIESVVEKNNLPEWLMNQQNNHIIGGKINLVKRKNINKLQKIRAYKGVRHEMGLPVRGQRTRGSFRKNKTVGVSRKKARERKEGE